MTAGHASIEAGAALRTGSTSTPGPAGTPGPAHRCAIEAAATAGATVTAGDTGRTRAAVTPGAAGAAEATEKATRTPGPAGTAICADRDGSATGAANPAIAEQPGPSTGPACLAGRADSTRAAAAEQEPTGAAPPTDRAGATGATDSAGTDQAGRPARATRLPGRAGPAVAAVAEQNPAGPAGGAAARCSTDPVPDQRALKQCLGGRVDCTQDVLSDRLQRRRVRRFCQGIRCVGRPQRSHQLVVEQRRLRAQRLILAAKPAEQLRDRERHFICGSCRDPSRHARGRLIGRPHR